jgi:hypothetical protein
MSTHKVHVQANAEIIYRAISLKKQMHQLFIAERVEAEVISGLRRARKLPGITYQTDRYFRSFIPYALDD